MLAQQRARRVLVSSGSLGTERSEGNCGDVAEPLKPQDFLLLECLGRPGEGRGENWVGPPGPPEAKEWWFLPWVWRGGGQGSWGREKLLGWLSH